MPYAVVFDRYFRRISEFIGETESKAEVAPVEEQLDAYVNLAYFDRICQQGHLELLADAETININWRSLEGKRGEERRQHGMLVVPSW